MMTTSVNKYHLENLDCAQCAANIESTLQKLPGVRFASVNFATETLHLDSDNPERALRAVRDVEPNVLVKGEANDDDDPNTEVYKDLTLIGLAIILFAYGMINRASWHNTDLERLEYLVFLSAYLLSGWGVLEGAARNIWRRNWFDETFLMSIATLGAILIHELPEAVGVMLFYKVGELLQDISVDRSRRSVKALINLQPDLVNLITDDGMRQVSVEEVQVGASIIVRPGEKIPLDSVVLEGKSQVDASTLTGEPVPVVVGVGDTVFAGTVNKMGLLTLKVVKPYDESAVARLMEMVENASSRKARTEKFITRFASYYTPVIVFMAAGVALLPPLFIPGASLVTWTYRALVLLVIACPCALMISIPLGYFGGIGGASRRGILVKGANFLDVLAGVRTVVFDKTGTLTKGVFKVIEVTPHNGYDEKELLRIANEVESPSTHPIARSIHEAYGGGGVNGSVESFEEIPGYGVCAVIKGRRVVAGNDALLHREGIDHEECDVNGTAVHIGVDGTYAGYIVVSDEMKEDSAEAVRGLHAVGVEDVVMLTGDRENIAADIAKKIGLDRYHAELLPEDKVAILEKIMADPENRKVAYVGDGINDAPSIARADVGIAMGELGSDAAIETADVVLMAGSPSKVAEAIAHARRTRKIVWQNIGFAFGVKAMFILLGLFGLASMWAAVFADVGVALLAVLNATRVLR
jgi:Cd2+/Zn2+-exporting ATPase